MWNRIWNKPLQVTSNEIKYKFRRTELCSRDLKFHNLSERMDFRSFGVEKIGRNDFTYWLWF